jgi:polysaccharide biosynthesis/export protein
MELKYQFAFRPIFQLSFALLCLFLGVQHVSGQQRVNPAPPPNSPAQPPEIGVQRTFSGYTIGSGDILDIKVADEDDMTGQYQVDGAGEIRLPLLASPFHAAGSTTFALASEISAALKKQEILKNPSVTIFIQRGVSHNITIMGPVSRPGLYPLESQTTTLLDAISMSGGLLPNAGPTATIARGAATANGAAGGTNESPTSVELSDLVSGKNPTLNVGVHPGDVITVSTAPVVYVVGAVVRPGAFAVQDTKRGLTVLQALAMVEGAQPTASMGHAMIVRQSASASAREEIPLNLNAVIRGKTQDPVLEANDILFIPESGFKKGTRRLGEAAVQAASQVTGYGLGLRVAAF